MTNSPKDLDMSDVERDAQNMMDAELDKLGDLTDPCDLFTVFIVLRDADDSLTIDSQLMLDIISATQSAPERAHNALAEMIAMYDRMNMNI